MTLWWKNLFPSSRPAYPGKFCFHSLCYQGLAMLVSTPTLQRHDRTLFCILLLRQFVSTELRKWWGSRDWRKRRRSTWCCWIGSWEVCRAVSWNGVLDRWLPSWKGCWEVCGPAPRWRWEVDIGVEEHEGVFAVKWSTGAAVRLKLRFTFVSGEIIKHTHVAADSVLPAKSGEKLSSSEVPFGRVFIAWSKSQNGTCTHCFNPHCIVSFNVVNWDTTPWMGGTFHSDKCFILIDRPQLRQAEIAAVYHSVAQLVRLLSNCHFRVDTLTRTTKGSYVIHLLCGRNDFSALSCFPLFSTFWATFRLISSSISPRSWHSADFTSWLYKWVRRDHCVF